MIKEFIMFYGLILHHNIITIQNNEIYITKTMPRQIFQNVQFPFPYSTISGHDGQIEIAFVMKERLQGPGVLPVDVIRATDFVVPAIEIVDFRVELGPGFGIVDTIADLAACGTAVLGANPRRLDQIDVRSVAGSIHKNGELVEQGTSDAVLGNPVTSVAWLANKLSQFGVTFEPGHTILTGSFTAAVPVGPGDVVVAEFDQGLGSVSTSFSTKENYS